MKICVKIQPVTTSEIYFQIRTIADLPHYLKKKTTKKRYFEYIWPTSWTSSHNFLNFKTVSDYVALNRIVLCK